MLADEGRWKGRQIIQSATLKEMYTNQLGSTKNSSRGFQFGLGFRISKQKTGHDYSWGGIAGTRFWVHPELNMVTLYMIQINPYGDRAYGNRVRKIAYEALEN
jgi:CubicO group peptidase (beta-lactamase class C family)